MQPIVVKKAWYKTWWGIIIIAAVCLVLALALALGALFYNYLQVIKSGRGDVLQKEMNRQTLTLRSEELAAIQKIRQELETSDDPFLGNQNADLVIVEFMDFKCPICKGQYPELQQLVSKYGYQIKLIIRDFPMESVHPGSTRLAAIASCAHEQGAFWLAHDYFFTNQDVLGEEFTDANVAAFSAQFGLDENRMNDCLKNRRGEIEVKSDYSIGYKHNIRKGTPTFFVNGQKVEGGIPFEIWETILKDLIQ